MQPNNTNSDASRWAYLEVPSQRSNDSWYQSGIGSSPAPSSAAVIRGGDLSQQQQNDRASEHHSAPEHKEHANLRRSQLHGQVIRLLDVAFHVEHAGTLSRMVELVCQAVAVGELTIEAMTQTSGSVISSLRSCSSSTFSSSPGSATSFSSGHPPNEPQLHHSQTPQLHLFQPHSLGRDYQSAVTTTSSVLKPMSNILASSPRLAPKQQSSDISYGSSRGSSGGNDPPSISYSPAPPVPASAPPHLRQQEEQHEPLSQSYQHQYYSPTLSSSMPLVASSSRRRTNRRKRSAYEKDKDARDLLRRMSATIKDDVIWTPDNWFEIHPLDPSITLEQFNAHYWPKELRLYKAAVPPKLWDALRLGRDMEFVYQHCIQEPNHSGISCVNSAESSPAPRGFTWKQWLQVYCEPHGINVQVANRNRRIWRVMRSYPLMQFSSAPLREVNKNVCGISRCLSTDPEARQFWSQNYKTFLESLPGSTAGADESGNNPSGSTPSPTIQLKRRKRSASSDHGTLRRDDAAPVDDESWRTSTSSAERCEEEEEEEYEDEEEEYDDEDLDTDEGSNFLAHV